MAFGGGVVSYELTNTKPVLFHATLNGANPAAWIDFDGRPVRLLKSTIMDAWADDQQLFSYILLTFPDANALYLNVIEYWDLMGAGNAMTDRDTYAPCLELPRGCRVDMGFGVAAIAGFGFFTLQYEYLGA